MLEDRIQKNLLGAGELFIYSLWLQSQMTDLIILSKHPKIRKRFVSRPQKIPATLRIERMKYWRKDFGVIRQEFEKEFAGSISVEAQSDLRRVYNLRNAIAHSYVSLARDYFLYRPSGKGARTRKLAKEFGVTKKADSAKPTLFKISFADDAPYLSMFAVMQRLDTVHLRSFADKLGIPHSRIR